MNNLSIPEDSVLRLSWPEFFNRVKAAETPEIFQTRLTVITAVRNLFSSVTHFCDLDIGDRCRIGGLDKTSEADYGWFGGIGSAGTFWAVIKQNNPNISAALDAVPLRGDITKLNYSEFLRHFKKAFPEGGGAISSATRLLTMKRPDVFVCISKRNRESLCKEFGTVKSTGLDTYWDRIVDPIMKSEWSKSACPDLRDEQDVWKARAAFLDAIFRRENM